MHLYLTDRLACPRCGPEFGLVLLAHDVRDRRILAGDLGCPNCRETYPVRGGWGDLRPPPRTPLLSGSKPKGEFGPAETLRVAALLGVTEGPGTLLLRGPAAFHAGALGGLVPGVEVVADHPGTRDLEEEGGVSRLVTGGRLPFFGGTFRAVLLSGGWSGADLEEGARVVAPLGRLVVLDAPPGSRDRMTGLGLEVLHEEGVVVVGRRSRAGPSPLVTLRGP